MSIRKIGKQAGKRVETGALVFGDDWPGLFIRGDDCILLSEAMRVALEYLPKDGSGDIMTFVARSILTDYIREIDKEVMVKAKHDGKTT